MPLYPTLEDLRVSELLSASAAAEVKVSQQGPSAPDELVYDDSIANYRPNYGQQLDFMGLDFSNSVFTRDGELVLANTSLPSNIDQSNLVVAPVSSRGDMTAAMASEIKAGVRKVVIQKNEKGLIGVGLTDLNSGVFVDFVQVGSKAAQAGLRFGDQVLSINGKEVAALKGSKASAYVSKSTMPEVELIVRDRPFERTITLNKDSKGSLGLAFSKGMISAVVKDSSASRNGLLTGWYIAEVDGCNVIGLADGELKELIKSKSNSVTLTVMPKVIYQHMIKNLNSKLYARMNRQ